LAINRKLKTVSKTENRFNGKRKTENGDFMPKCTVCSHPERYAIDRALLAGKTTYESLSRCYGPSTSAIYRHKQHLRENIFETRQRLKNDLSFGFLFKLNKILDRIENASQKAEAEDNVDQILKTARVGNRLIRDLSKMDAPWDSDTVYRLMASPQWTSRDILLPTDPDFLAAGHQTLAASFFDPCPEPPPDADLADDKDESHVGRESGAPPAVSSISFHPALTPEILAGLHPDLLASLLDTLSQPPEPATPPRDQRCVGRESKAHPAKKNFSSEPANPATPPRRQRENSAKLARKSRSTKKNNKVNQQDKPAKKSIAKKPQNSPADPPPEAPAAGHCPPATDTLEHESLFDRLRRKWSHPTDVTPFAGAPAPFSEDHLQENLDTTVQVSGDAVRPASAAPPADPGNGEPETAAPPADACHLTAQDSTPSPATSNEKPETSPVDPEPLPDPNAPVETVWKPGVYPEGYLFAVTHGYWPDNPPKKIPDRRWEEDFGNPRHIKGTY
jgi:hypothetical protein